MMKADDRHDMVQYFYSFGMLLRMILDFNSYKSAGDSLYSETGQSDNYFR